MSTTHIDLSRVPAPDVIEVLDPEQIMAESKAFLAARAPELAPYLALESDPVVKVVEVLAYRDILGRNRVNQAAKAVMLAYATGADLDNLAALFAVTRLVLVPADPNAIPPVEEVLEPDDDLRRRVQLAPEGATAAGTVGSYTFYALSASPDVADATAENVVPGSGQVVITVLDRQGDGTPPPALLQSVATAMEPYRPLCIELSVAPPTVLPYAIEATLTFLPGPDASVAMATAQAAVEDLVARSRRLGRDVTRAAIVGAVMQEGVQNVDLIEPAADVVCAPTDVGHCTGITLTDGGRDV